MYVRERRDLSVDGRQIWVILARSSTQTPCAEKSGVLRVKDYKQSVALESDGTCGTKGNTFTRAFTSASVALGGDGNRFGCVKWFNFELISRINVCFVSVFMNYFDNPGGMIPTWLVNWAAKVGAPVLLCHIFIRVSVTWST